MALIYVTLSVSRYFGVGFKLGSYILLKAKTWMPVLRELSKGGIVTETELCKKLDTSLRDVRQRLKFLLSLGLPIERAGSKCALDVPIYIPSSRVLQVQTGLQIQYYDELESTNTEMLLSHDKPDCVIALYQTAGRGRRGRAWTAAPGCALMFSLGKWMTAECQVMSTLSIWIGIIVCQYLNSAGIRARLKWPNDLWIDNAKIAGLLIESHGGRDQSYVVVGLGINLALTLGVDTPMSVVSNYLGRPWSDDDTAGLVIAIDNAIRDFPTITPSALQKSFSAVSLLDGLLVKAHKDGVLTEGVVEGIDELGRLCIATNTGLKHLLAADVSLRFN